jgi:ribose transport system substrate-binding protein
MATAGGLLYKASFVSQFLVIFALLTRTASIADVVAIMPNRATAYPNGLHNGMLLSAFRQNISLEIRDVGDFDLSTSYQVLESAIASPEQPKIYCIWPVDLPSKRLVQTLYQTHGVPIIQINQLPGAESQWEWEHLLGYAGPDDSLRAHNAGIMMVSAMGKRNIKNAKVVALGYPETYGGYHLSIAAFRDAIDDSDIDLIDSLHLDWGSQNAFNAMVRLIDDFVRTGDTLHGVYAMDDDILNGAYQALADRGMLDSVTLVGTVCNGARELLEDGRQFGTTVQSPFLEAVLAIDSASEYLQTGVLSQKVRFTPNPILTGSSFETMILEFLGETYVADDLCTWSLQQQRSNGLNDVEAADDICAWIDCLYIPNGLVMAGYTMAAFNYFLALGSAILIVFYRHQKVMRLAQPSFLLLVTIGTVVDSTSIIFMSRDNRNYSEEQLDAACFAWPWLLSLGQMMTTATLVAKIYRVKAVTAATSSSGGAFRRVEVHAADVSGFIIGGLVFDFIILGVWYGTDPFRYGIRVVSEDSSGFILSARGECRSEGDHYWVYPTFILLAHFALLIYANLLAYQTRLYHKISDSKMVAISLFNSIQLLLVASFMLALSGDNVSISYAVRVCYAFLNNIGVLALIVCPKVYVCLKGRGNIMPNISHHRTSSKARTNANISGLEPQDEGNDDSTLKMKQASGIGATSWAMVGTGSDLSQIPEDSGSDLNHIPQDSAPTSLQETKTGSAAEITPSLTPHYSSQNLWMASADGDEAGTETAETETNDQVVDSEDHDAEEIDANTDLTGH